MSTAVVRGVLEMACDVAAGRARASCRERLASYTLPDCVVVAKALGLISLATRGYRHSVIDLILCLVALCVSCRARIR